MLGLFAFLASDAQEAAAQPSPRRVEFTLRVEAPRGDGGSGVENLETKRDREMAHIAAERIKTRLNAIDVKNYRVQVDNQNRIQVTVYGRDLSAEAIKSAVIPPGELELRAVISGATPWGDILPDLPEGVEIRVEPGAFQTDRTFLYSEDITTLQHLLSRISLGQTEVTIFPFRNGWRTVLMGPSLGSHHDVLETSLNQTPSAIPFVTVQLTADATSRVRAGASQVEARHLAILLDGELVAMPRFIERQFDDELTLDCPDFFRSSEARRHWAMQVAGRLAVPIPVTLIESKEY